MKTKSINRLKRIPLGDYTVYRERIEQWISRFLWNFKFIAILTSFSLFMSCESTVDDTDQFAALNNSEIATYQDGHARNALPNAELAQLRAAMAPYHNMEKAMDDGYIVVASDNVPHMGIHYLNPAYLEDGKFELKKPELLLYVPAPNGKFRLVAVEYATPIANLEDPPPPPEGFTGDADEWEINYEVSLWTLHAWIWLHNPDGIFASHNPRVE